MTIPDRVTIEQKSKTTAARCQIPPNGVTIDRSWPKGINRNRSGSGDSYGGQSTDTEKEGSENHWCLYRDDDKHKLCGTM